LQRACLIEEPAQSRSHGVGRARSLGEERRLRRFDFRLYARLESRTVVPLGSRLLDEAFPEFFQV
jgi:hypothetical protein